jgi:hypothetical protein
MTEAKTAKAEAKTAKPKTPKAKAVKPWRGTVNLDRLDPATGQWRITTGAGKDPLPREVATDPAVFASITGWMQAHRARSQPSADESAQLDEAIRSSVTAAFRAMPPGSIPAPSPRK